MKKIIYIFFFLPFLANAQFAGNEITRDYATDTLVGFRATNTNANGQTNLILKTNGDSSWITTNSAGVGIFDNSTELFKFQTKLRAVHDSYQFLLDDTITLISGASANPFAGVSKPAYFGNAAVGILDFSSSGSDSASIYAGIFDGVSTPHGLTVLGMDSSVELLSRKGLELNAANDIGITASQNINMDANQFNLTGDTLISSSSKRVSLIASEDFVIEASDATAHSFGVSAYGNNAFCCNNTATLYKILDSLSLDVDVYGIASSGMYISHKYDVADATHYNQNWINITDNLVEMIGGDSTHADPGAKIGVSTSQINFTGEIIPSANASYGIGNASFALDSIFSRYYYNAYGEMGFGDSSSTLALTQNTPTWVTNTANDLWSAESSQNNLVSYAGDSLSVSASGNFLVTVQLTLNGLTGSTIEMGVYKNGSEDCSCTSQVSLHSATNRFSLNYTDITDVSFGDSFKIFVQNTQSNDDIDIIAGQITISKVN